MAIDSKGSGAASPAGSMVRVVTVGLATWALACSGGGGGALSCDDEPCVGAECSPDLLYRTDPSLVSDFAVGGGRLCMMLPGEYVCLDRCSGSEVGGAEVPIERTSGMVVVDGDVTIGSTSGLDRPGALWRGAATGPAVVRQIADVPGNVLFKNMVSVGGFLYFGSPVDLDYLGVNRIRYEGGEVERLSDWDVAFVPNALAMVSADAYFISADARGVGVYSVPESGGPPRLVQSSDLEIAGIATNDEYLVSANATADGQASILAMALRDGSTVPLIATSGRPLEVIADATRVYAVLAEANGATLVSVAIPGGASLSIATHAQIQRIRQDDEYIYYLNQDGVARVGKD